MEQQEEGWEDERRKVTWREETRKKWRKTKRKPYYLLKKRYQSKEARVAFTISVDTLIPTHKKENMPKFQLQSNENWIKKQRAASRK